MEVKQEKKEIDAIKRISKQIELANHFIKIMELFHSRKTSLGLEDSVLKYSAKLQRDMNQYGYGKMQYKPPFATYMHNNYEIFSNLPTLMREPYFIQEMLPTVRTVLYGYLTFLEERKESIENNGLEEDIQSPNISVKLDALEKTLIEVIYDFVVKNPNLGATKSGSITQSRKKGVKKRDNYVCQICQETFPEDQLEIDHIFPHSLGGSNHEYNLMPLCSKCNADKGNRLTYYQSDEGKNKLRFNINKIVKNLPIIHNFGDWLKKQAVKTPKNK